MKKISLFTVFALLFASNMIFAQTFHGSIGIQDSLSKLSSRIWKLKSDSSKLQVNDEFFRKFQAVLETSSKDILLDSIYGITHVESVDRQFRVFTWNVPLSDGSNKYFGFIQYRTDNSIIIPLRSFKTDSDSLDSKQFTPKNWYGAVYYKLIEVEINNEKAYTLLGWDGFTLNSNRKIIDIIFTDKTGNIVLGMPVFKTDKGIKTRVVFEYAEKANMLLRYDYQTIMIEKKKKVKKEKAWIIVMDRMVPMDPSMEGIRKYYVPKGDNYDGYIFRDGYWCLVENIEVANNQRLSK